MSEIFIAAFILLFAVFFWWHFVYTNKNDLIFIAIGFIYLTGAAVSNDWITRCRYLGLPFLICGLFINRKTLLKEGKGLICCVGLIYGSLILGSLWGEYARTLFLIKLRIGLYAIGIVLAGSFVNSYVQYRKLMLTLSPVAIIHITFLLLGNRMIGTDERLQIDLINPNGLSIYFGVAASILLMSISCFNLPILIKTLFLPFTVAGYYYLIRTGSRAGILSIMMCTFVMLVPPLMTGRRNIIAGISFLVIICATCVVLWIDLPQELKIRIVDYSNTSGRDVTWDDVVNYEMNQMAWYGVGSNVYINSLNDVAWGSLLNIYLDVYYELNWIGVAVGGIFLGTFLLKGINVFYGFRSPLKYCAFAWCIVGLLEGVAEAVPIRPPHPGAIIFLLGIGILSQMKREYVWMYDVPQNVRVKRSVTKGVTAI